MKNNANIKTIDKSIVVLTCLLAGMFFYIVSSFIPIVLDDCAYALSKSLKEIVTYQAADYMAHNGRVFAHGLGQVFSGILGKGVFNVFTAVVFVGLILLISKLSAGRDKWWIAVPLAFGMVWFLYPDQYTTMGMVAGSMNYLWASVIVLLFVLLFFQCVKQSFSQLAFVAFAFLSLLAGAWSEMYTVSIGPALFIYLLLNRDKCSRQTMISFLLFGIGAAFMVFAPGNFGRMEMVTGGQRASLSTYFLNVVCEILKGPIVWIWIGIVVLLVAEKVSGILSIKFFLKENMFWLVAMAFSLVFIWISAASWSRTFFAVYTYSFILLLKLLLQMPLKRWMWTFVVVLVLVAISCDFAKEVKVCSYNYKILEDLKQEVGNNSEKTCFPFPKMQHSRKAIGNDVLRQEQGNWRNGCFQKYYGLPHPFSVIPEEVFNACRTNADIVFPLDLNDYVVYPVERTSDSIAIIWKEEEAYLMKSKPKRLLAAMGWKKVGRKWYQSQSELPFGKLLLEQEDSVKVKYSQLPNADFENFGYYEYNNRIYLYVPEKNMQSYDGEVLKVVQLF